MKKFRRQVLEVVGSEVTPAQADTACLHFLQTFLRLNNCLIIKDSRQTSIIRQKRLSMELLKALKSEYGGITQAQAEKLLNTVKELVDDLSDEVMEALAMGESEEEMGPMFGANIKFTPPTGDPYDALDLSYLSNVVDVAGAFNLGSSLSFKLDSLPKVSSDGNVECNMIDTTWLEETLREAYPDQQVRNVTVFQCRGVYVYVTFPMLLKLAF